MKKYLSIALVLFLSIVLITGCGKKETKKTEKKESIDDYIGTYTSSDESMLIIGSMDGKYLVDLSLYRLASFEGGATKIKDGVITIESKDPNGNDIEFKFNVRTKKLTVSKSSWNYLQKGQKFDFNN